MDVTTLRLGVPLCSARRALPLLTGRCYCNLSSAFIEKMSAKKFGEFLPLFVFLPGIARLNCTDLR